jgi:cell division protein FtsL
MVIKMRSKTKRKFICIFLLTVIVAMASGVAFLVHFYNHMGAETYDAAVVAGDAGDERKAIALFREACREGSDLACKAIYDDQGRKSVERK